MPVANITAKFVAQVKPPASGRVYYTDAKLPGFALCVSSTGSKVFYRIGRTHRGVTRTKIEKYPKVSADVARDLCVQVHADILEGKPPRTRLAKNAKSVQYVWEWHLRHNLKPHNRTWEADERTYNLRIADWGKLPIQDLTRGMVTERGTQIYENSGASSANKFLSVMRGICKTAKAENWSAVNAAEQVRKYRVAKRSRFLDEAEIILFFQNLEKLKLEKRDFFLICLFTAARRSTVCSMSWADIDFDNSTWTIPGTLAKGRKGRDPITLPLVDAPLRILERRRLTARSPWVFPSNSAAGHLMDPKRQWQKLLKDSGLPDLKVHDLRRTLASLQAIAGVPLQTIGATLGHGENLSATLVYARLNTMTVRKAVQDTVSKITLLVEATKLKTDEKHFGNTSE